MKEWLQTWLPGWSAYLLVAGQVALVLLIGYVLQRFVARAVTGLGERYPLPPQIVLGLRGTLRWLIMGSAILMALERFGVSAAVLWTAISGFVAVAAVAFFAIWSVLSNLFCAVLIFTVGPFRLGDRIEVLDASDKPGIKGRVVAINMLFVTLQELDEQQEGALVQIPNTQFFQKSVRRWRDADGSFDFHLDR
ncbi:mechanosensitive ion channel family protein [Pseudomonas oryzihabitans]|uniref:Small-conductance mechanosensitive channel n=1 Tax=Pseudomonas oryzihabitans TaxID=47885 RepID=A0AAJ2BLQ7_9PSED|nr:mechanosensitive ion channel family protein [Pseudomonas psychrotolerans]MDR6234700.1 small-conductance mechanosensitive channel [Pseudomonas psychrotolerans]MDR6356142.1 small-conductance mechanosensitive channel [Pseudomonas psychrotolerans]MDR6677151.1 small-conductance mechanosensitive channel [Pseudomonas psychrotolerans]QDD90797.1 hypothetical protein CCZ28_17955 [Pseudomonas psychrotolerans]